MNYAVLKKTNIKCERVLLFIFIHLVLVLNFVEGRIESVLKSFKLYFFAVCRYTVREQ